MSLSCCWSESCCSSLVGIFTGSLGYATALASMGNGISGMFETMIVTILVASIASLMKENGGFEAILSFIRRKAGNKRGGMFGIAFLTAFMDIATANNTVAIVIAAPIAKDISEEYGVEPNKTASLLDTCSCIMQGIIPYGAQLLVAAGIAQVTSVSLIPFLIYPFLLAKIRCNRGYRMKTLSKGKMWCFAIGQFGWSLLSALITNWLVYFYQPDAESIAAGQTLFIPQGRVIFGIATVIGGIAALGRVFDAVTDPMIANLSDRSQNPRGRRIPFMQKIAVPFALITVLVFWAPVNEHLDGELHLASCDAASFYLFMTTYCTPYNALISELGTTQDTRISISTYISVTFLLGSAVGYAAPFIWGALEPSMGRVTAIRITFLILSGIGSCGAAGAHVHD